MNVDEKYLERKYYKVKVPSEFIHTIKFRLNSASLYLLIFFIIFVAFIMFLNFINEDFGLHNKTVFVSVLFLFFTIVGFVINEIYNRKIISLMKNGILTNATATTLERDLENLNDYHINYKYENEEGKYFYKKGLTKIKDLKTIDILYSKENPKKSFILNNNFRSFRIDIDEIIRLVNEYSTPIENK